MIKEKIKNFAIMANADNTDGRQGVNIHQERDNPQKRRSGLYGLSVIAVTLRNRNKQVEHLDRILSSVIKSFNDKDQKVQLAALEAMFNIINVYKEAILRSKHFLDIFSKII